MFPTFKHDSFYNHTHTPGINTSIVDVYFVSYIYSIKFTGK